ncbi:MAG: hypothetical protein M3Y57_13850 [Acidobacteriota bacterium]|nr:hypothetical protein [Acidobacteriota bacterium]
MDELKERENKQLDYLLADFVAAKSEMARRSTLQWIILGGYFSTLAFVFQKSMNSGFSGLWLTALWIVSFGALLFYAREDFTIRRLGRDLIRNRIAASAGSLINVNPEGLLPSESHYKGSGDRRAHWYARLFNWTAFFIAPLLLTLLCFFWHWSRIDKLADFRSLAPWEAITSAICAGTILFLLYRLPENAKANG